MIDDGQKGHKHEAEEIKEILDAVSTQVPALIKSVLGSVFSEEAGKSMGKAAASYYKELKNGGMPEQVAVKMTEEYMRTFTSLGDMLRGVGRGKWKAGAEEDLGEEIERKIREKHEREEHETEQKGDE